MITMLLYSTKELSMLLKRIGIIYIVKQWR